MSLAKAETVSLTPSSQRSTFFRQSGWLMIANIAGGTLMWAVHLLNKFLPSGQYGDFGVFLAALMLVPNIPLQMTLTQQTARGLANDTKRQLSGILRLFLLISGLIWLVLALTVLCFQREILAHLKMTNSTGLWITVVIALITIWLPMFWGMLQGQQNFFWLGWSMMGNSIGRLSAAAVAVIVFKAGAAGMMIGVLVGFLIALSMGAWHSRSLWLAAPLPFDWRGLLRQVIPLLLAFVGFQILFTGDTILVKNYFEPTTADFYVSAGTLSRALLWIVLPMAYVMFPRLVHSAAKSEKSNLLGMVLLGTAILAVVGALGLSLLGPWVVQLIYTPAFAKVAPSLLPWYSAAMVPLALSNVLLNNLLARPASKLPLAICVLLAAIAYIFALNLPQFHDRPVTVLKVMGIANIVLLAICSLFTWRSKSSPSPAPAA
jgi:O-antigen/teichoic acid export membrane protein